VTDAARIPAVKSGCRGSAPFVKLVAPWSVEAEAEASKAQKEGTVASEGKEELES